MSYDHTYDDWRWCLASRITEERETKLKLSLKAFVSRIPVSERMQRKYEMAEAMPDIWYFQRLDREGADVCYIITGERAEVRLTTEEQALVRGYHKLDEGRQAEVRTLIGSMETPPAMAATAYFHERVGQAVQGNVIGSVTINMAGAKKKKK